MTPLLDERQRPKQSMPNGSPNSGCLAVVLFALAAWWAAGGFAHAQTSYFALKPGDVNRDVTDAQLRLPTVCGLTPRVRWRDVHPAPGVFNLAEIDQNLAQAKRCGGKRVKLLVQTGRDVTPAWFKGQWLKSGKQSAPAPWSPEFALAHEQLVAKLGERYAAHPLIEYVHVTGPTWPSAEMHPMPGIENAAGYSDSKMVAAWSRSIDAYARAFPTQGLCLSISMKPPANRYVGEVIGYAKRRCGARLVLQHNALQADTDVTAPHHRLLLKEHAAGVRIAFEMACSAVNEPTRFGSRDVMQGVQLGRAAGAEFIDVYPPDLKGLK